MNLDTYTGSRLQRFKALAEQAASTGIDMRVPEQPEQPPVVRQAQRDRIAVALSPLDHEARKDARVLSRDQLLRKYGPSITDRAITAIKSEAPTPREVFTKHQKQERENNRELGKGLAAAGVELKHHSEKDFTHVIVTQLDLLQTGVDPSVSAVVNAAFPDDPKKATSIKNSQHGKRRRKAWHSPAVMNHPMEKAMQQMHGKESMNRRHSARTFGQSLGMNATLFKSCDRITKLEARVQLLEQQMRETKARESLADAGCANSREMVLALYSQGKGPTAIARELGMNQNTVKSIIGRSKAG